MEQNRIVIRMHRRYVPEKKSVENVIFKNDKIDYTKTISTVLIETDYNYYETKAMLHMAMMELENNNRL